MYLAALGFSLLCFLGVCLYYFRSPAFSVFHPLTFYTAFHGLVFVLRPFIVWWIDLKDLYYGYEFMPSLSDKVTVLVASNMGFLVFALFCLRAAPSPMRFNHSEVTREQRRRLSSLFIWVIVICGPPAAYSLLNSYGSSTNFDGMVLDRGTGITINTKNIGYVTDLQMMAVSLSAMIAWLARFRLYSLLPIASFVLMRAGTGGRSPFVIALVSAALFYMYEKRLRMPSLRVTIGAALLLAVFGAVGQDRGAAIRQTLGLEEKSAFAETDRPQGTFLTGMDYANMEFFEYLVYVIPQRSQTYDYFLDNLQVFTEPVPRVFWSGKPVGEPLRRIDLFQYGYPIGMSRSLPGEGWYALGWVGVIVWCALWGMALGKIYEKFVSGRQDTFAVACYLVFLPTLIVVFRDGTLLQLVRSTGIYFTPIAVWYLLARYVGVPRLNDIAASLVARRRNGGGTAQAGPGTAPAPAAARALTSLPPAVRRRRMALANTPPTPPE